MLRIVCLVAVIFFSITIFSQKPKQVIVSVQKPVAPKILKDLRDSVSYTAGIHIVNKYRSQNIYNLNSAAVAKACNDLQSNSRQLLSNSDADNAVMAYQAQLMTDPKMTVKPVVAGVSLNDIRDSASYAAGIYLINFFREFDITNFNPAIITRAINDLQSQKKPLLNDSLANMVAMRYQYKVQEIKNKPTIDAGKKFLAENKKRPGVKVTKSGLQYEIITIGTGKKPTKKDTVSCNYTGAFIDGTEFNNSYKMGGPISFAVNGVIKGWTEALQMMPVGSKWKLYIPYTLAYGPGQYQTIPGGSALVFEIDLIEVVNK
jgi:FKBP-type peptidyl-prolyl cis-trans isomerase FklB